MEDSDSLPSIDLLSPTLLDVSKDEDLSTEGAGEDVLAGTGDGDFVEIGEGALAGTGDCDFMGVGEGALSVGSGEGDLVVVLDGTGDGDFVAEILEGTGDGDLVVGGAWGFEGTGDADLDLSSFLDVSLASDPLTGEGVVVAAEEGGDPVIVSRVVFSGFER